MMPEQRTMAQVKQHYEVEKELAAILRNASRQDRAHLYASLYNELYRRVPLHPQITNKASSERTADNISQQIEFLGRFLNDRTVFLEVGPGDCALSLEVTKYVRQVYAVDVSHEITKGFTPPSNFQLILSDGCNIPVPKNSVHVAYSNQLMEHLHPDDAFEQLQNIHRALIPGGVYICITPNRLSGPHDISRYFDKEATGFHLKEYTTSELGEVFKKVGFSKVKSYFGVKGRYATVPLFCVMLYERLLEPLPYSARVLIARNRPFRILSRPRIVGIK